ncbi:MAG TPA: hypothetical protein VFP59_03510 [Candidatus Angelobacter sp.]|nr:hypothetical protein [Candidatus Angelobacter sp.]
MKINPSSCCAIVLILVFAPLLEAQKSSPAPLPSELLTAKKIFIANGGGPSDLSGYTGTDTRTYDQFFAALKTWGHYELVSSPADAELIFEISFACPLVPFSTSDGYSVPTPTKPAYDPHFKLAITDVKTHVTIWIVIQHINLAILQKNSDKNFDNAITALVNNIAKLAGTTPATVAAREKEAAAASR